MGTPTHRGMLYVIVCAAPPAAEVQDLVKLAQAAGWEIAVTATPEALAFIDAPLLAAITGLPVRHRWREPEEPETVPEANAIVVAPATFNTINRWVAGITNTVAVGTLCEYLDLPPGQHRTCYQVRLGERETGDHQLDLPSPQRTEPVAKRQPNDLDGLPGWDTSNVLMIERSRGPTEPAAATPRRTGSVRRRRASWVDRSTSSSPDRAAPASSRNRSPGWSLHRPPAAARLASMASSMAW